MRIVIDMQGAQTDNRFRGIGRYSLALTLAMARNAPQHEIWLVLNAALPESIPMIRHAFDGLIPAQQIRIFDVPTPVAENNPNHDWCARAAEKIREHFIQQLQPDIVFITSLFEGYNDDAVTSIGRLYNDVHTAVILYDLIPFLKPAAYLNTPLQRQHYERKIASLKKADLLFAISSYTKQEAIDTLALQPESIINISAAIDARFQPCKDATRRAPTLLNKLGIYRKMVMYAPGGFDSRKNFATLIQAYALLPAEIRANHQLVIASKISDGDRARLEQLQSKAGLDKDELILTGYVSDDDLVLLYNLATLFVFPSTHEGFGMPILEAMACGAPTIGSNTTSIPEVIGYEKALFDPHSAQSICDKMTLILQDDTLRGELAQHGLQQATTFSWDVSAKRVIAGLESWHASLPDHLKQQGTIQDVHTLLTAIANIHHNDDAACPATERDLRAAANAIAFNIGGHSKQLLIDISEIVQRDAKSGIQRVVRSILLELLQHAPDGYTVHPIYFDGEVYRHANHFMTKFLEHFPSLKISKNINYTDDVAEFNQDDIYLGLDLNAHLTNALHPHHQRLKMLGVQLYFVVYDILLIHRPDWWHTGTSEIFEKWLNNISQIATGLVCISAAVAQEVQKWLMHNQPNRYDVPVISSFHLGADLENSVPTQGLPENAQSVLDAIRAYPSFLMVGTIEPRKGHAQTLAAFESLWQRGVPVNLVIVGKEGWLVKDLVKQLRHHTQGGEHLFWLEGVSDEYLERIYQASTCLIAASEGEGFGLPLIEAAQHKLPIIARDLPIFREVAGQHAFYFQGLRPLDLANAISNWLALRDQSTIPSSQDMPWLTWQQSVQQLLANILPTSSSSSSS